MVRIIPFNRDRDRHDEVRLLLPWYVTGRLEAGEHAKVEAHLRECAECQKELRQEQRLDVAVGALDFDVEHGWADMRRRLQPAPSWRARVASWRPRAMAALGVVTTPQGLGWAVGVQLALVLSATTLLVAITRPAQYHALGSAQAPAAGNVLVIFRPETSEAELRGVLVASDARLVDGPTSAGAYVLAVRPATRSTTLNALRERPQVLLAQPIDAGAEP
jgi:anti-sigma factor RsiW